MKGRHEASGENHFCLRIGQIVVLGLTGATEYNQYLALKYSLTMEESKIWGPA